MNAARKNDRDLKALPPPRERNMPWSFPGAFLPNLPVPSADRQFGAASELGPATHRVNGVVPLVVKMTSDVKKPPDATVSSSCATQVAASSSVITPVPSACRAAP